MLKDSIAGLNALSAVALPRPRYAECREPFHNSQFECMSLVSKVGALWWLRQLLVRRSCHVPPDLDENRLHCEVALPHTDAREFREVHLSDVSAQACLIIHHMLPTFPVCWFTQGRLTLLMNVTSGGESG